MPASSRLRNNVAILCLCLSATACGPVLKESGYPNRHVLAQEQTTQGRYYNLEQAMTDAAAESLGQAATAHQEATQAKKDAMDAKQLAETVAAGTKDLSLSLEEIRAALADIQSRPGSESYGQGTDSLKTFMVVLMRVPDAALGLDARGPEVRQVNLLLIVAGYLKETTVQETYNKKTMAAVKELQKSSQLPVTGVFDDATSHALASKLGATNVPIMIMTGAPSAPVSPNPFARSESSATSSQKPGPPVTPTAGTQR